MLFASLRGYRRQWLGPDAVAGLMLLAIAVPEQLATSRLANMPPITGLYAFIAGTVLFAMLGSNPRMSVGADSTIAPLFAVGVARFAPVGSAGYVHLVAILAVVVGVMVALVGLLRLGWIAEFLSAPIITGFLAGVAVIIVVHQIPDLLGLPTAGGSTMHRLRVIADHINDVNWWVVGIAVGVVAVVVGAEQIDRKLPGALVALIGAAAVVAVAGLRAHGVAVLGRLPSGAPHLGLTGMSWSALAKVAPLGGAVAFVVIVQSAATTRAFEDPRGRAVDVSRDFLGVGVGSVAAGLVGAFPVNASPPRTAAVAGVGGRTQATGLGAAAAVVLLVPAVGLLRDVPVVALAAILLFVASRLFRPRDLLAVARFDVFEFGLTIVTLATVALVGVEQGILVAVGLAILDRTRLSARPQLHVLGRIPGTTSWAPLGGAEHAAEVPGVLVVLFATPLWYANAVHFHAQVDEALGAAVERPRVVVLDAIGMSDIDYTGSLALRAVLDELDRARISFAVARAGKRVRASLARSGLHDRVGDDRFFPAVDEAVTAMSRRPGEGPTGVPPGV